MVLNWVDFYVHNSFWDIKPLCQKLVCFPNVDLFVFLTYSSRSGSHTYCRLELFFHVMAIWSIMVAFIHRARFHFQGLAITGHNCVALWLLFWDIVQYVKLGE